MQTTALLTYKDVQRVLGLSRWTIRRMVDSGDLTPIHLGPQSVRFDAADVEALIERRRRRRMPDAA